MEKEITIETLKAINHLLATPIGEQLYRKEINMLFKILELLSSPIFITKQDHDQI